MPLLVYRPSLFRQQAENLQFRLLCEELQRRVRRADERGKPEICLFVGNFNFTEKEFDAFLIKKNGILLIEFKNYGGKIHIDNNQWKGEYDGQEFIVKGGSGGKTPLEQAKNNRNAFKRDLRDCGALTEEQADKIASVVVFNHDCEIENKLRLNIRTWLNVCDNNGFFGVAESVINTDMDFTAVQLKALSERIVLDDDYIVEEFSDMDFLENVWQDEEELQKYSDKLAGIVKFPDEPDPIRADQEGEIDYNPEQNPQIMVVPVLPPDPEPIAEEPVHEHIEEAVPCEDVPKMIANYVSLVQMGAMGSIPFFIYDCTQSAPLVDFDIEERYLIRVMADPTDINAYNLSSFIHKDVHIGQDCLYWTIGDKIEKIKAVEVKVATANAALELRQSSARLAPWLDSFIYKHLGASYDPRYNRFDYNDDLGEEEAKIYLGTYFPRSYAENFLIFENLLQNPRYRARIEAKQNLVVFSIGAGTGGDIIGLLTAVDKFIRPEISVTVIALDVNAFSLDLQKQVVERYKTFSGRKITLQQFEDRIEGRETLLKYADNAFPDKSIDYLLFSKVGCELHGRGVFEGENVYKIILDTFMSKISEVGILSLLDVTTKVDGELFMPFIMNQGVNAFVASHGEFSTLVPQSCCAYEHDCTTPCFFQQEVFVSHCKKTNDLSKICYRLVAHREMCDAVLNSTGKRFVINPAKLEYGDDDAFCRMSANESEIRDAFNVNN